MVGGAVPFFPSVAAVLSPRVVHMRGATVLARIDWIRRHHGHDAVERVLASMLPRHADVIRGAVVPGLWIEFEAVMAFIQAIDKVFGHGDLSLVRPLARHAARTNMPLLYKIFYKLGSVEFIMTKAAAVWHAHYDSGAAASHSIPGGLRFTIRDFATPHRVHCLTVLGWAEELVRLSSAELVLAREVQCRLSGGPVCEFEVTYRQ